VRIASSSRLWGAEANGVMNLLADNRVRFDGLVGFRYLSLQEGLGIDTDQLFAAAPPFAPSALAITTSDRFSTRNQFYGGQVGGRLSWRGGRVSLNLLGKVGLGSTHQPLRVNGTATATGSGVLTDIQPVTVPGGVFAQASNIGRRSRDQFAVISEAGLGVTYSITHRIQAGVGSNFLYWSSVVRPGDQIDRNVNITRAALPLIGSTPTGPVAPLPRFDRDDFFAHGVSFTLGLSF